MQFLNPQQTYLTHVAIIATIAFMLNPAKNVFEKIGGPTEAAKMVGVERSTAYRWGYPKDKGGTGGLIPAEYQRVLLERARDRGLHLTPSDFFDFSDSGIS